MLRRRGSAAVGLAKAGTGVEVEDWVRRGKEEERGRRKARIINMYRQTSKQNKKLRAKRDQERETMPLP